MICERQISSLADNNQTVDGMPAVEVHPRCE
jgi:hypothetical protein